MRRDPLEFPPAFDAYKKLIPTKLLDALPWSKDVALQAIEWATTSAIAVTGVNHPNAKLGWQGDTMRLYVWVGVLDADELMGPGETWKQFVHRCNEGARRYISKFSWDDADVLNRDQPLQFSIQFCTEGEYKDLVWSMQ